MAEMGRGLQTGENLTWPDGVLPVLLAAGLISCGVRILITFCYLVIDGGPMYVHTVQVRGLVSCLSRGGPRCPAAFISSHLLISRATGGKIRKGDLTCMTWAGPGRQGQGRALAWHGSKTSNLSALLPPDPCSGWTVSQGSTNRLHSAARCPGGLQRSTNALVGVAEDTW